MMAARFPHLLKRLTLFVCLVASGMAQVNPMDGVDDISQIPQRPVNHILDAARWFSLNEKESVGSELARIYKENEIDVYVVTLSKNPPQGAQTYTRKLGESWSRSAVWCVVLYVPGDPSGFHIEAGGVDVKRVEIEQAVAEASKRARMEMTEKDRVIAAYRECSESLRFMHSQSKRMNERVVKRKIVQQIDRVKLRRETGIIIAVVAIGTLLLALGASMVFCWLKRRRAVFEFPKTNWRTRFEGPHSGGSGIVVNYRRKRLK